VDRDSCPLVKLGAHCDKGEKEKNAEKITGQIDEMGTDCCAFIPLFFDKTRTNDGDQQTSVAVPPVLATSSIVVSTLPGFTPARFYSPPHLYRNNTFLKNRNFRI
jgi:hypothetical protein